MTRILSGGVCPPWGDERPVVGAGAMDGNCWGWLGAAWAARSVCQLPIEVRFGGEGGSAAASKTCSDRSLVTRCRGRHRRAFTWAGPVVPDHMQKTELQGLPIRMQGQLLHVAKVTGQRVAVNAQTASDRC